MGMVAYSSLSARRSSLAHPPKPVQGNHLRCRPARGQAPPRPPNPAQRHHPRAGRQRRQAPPRPSRHSEIVTRVVG